jgi:hypothetical protein
VSAAGTVTTVTAPGGGGTAVEATGQMAEDSANFGRVWRKRGQLHPSGSDMVLWVPGGPLVRRRSGSTS